MLNRNLLSNPVSYYTYYITTHILPGTNFQMTKLKGIYKVASNL